MSKVFTITEGLENLGALRTGGQGSVYKGRRMGPVLTAIKLLPTPIHAENDDDRNFRNFNSEVAKLQKVNEIANPNVVKFLSSGITESGSLPYIEMEYIEGPDLGELLQPPHEKIFMLKEAIRVAYQLSGALAHCHKVGVKHGDVKSNNVKYNVNTGNYVLLDFGLAIMLAEQRRSSIRHAGAVEFMAPEQQDGEMLPQTDVYSFGVILYELLAGVVPFPLHGNSETGRNMVMLAHLETPVPDVLTARQAAIPVNWTTVKQISEMQVPPWLLHIINKCLEKNPADRYTSGIELHEAVINGNITVNTPGGQELLQETNERLQKEINALQQVNAQRDEQLATLKGIALAAGAKYDQDDGTYKAKGPGILIPKLWFAGLLATTVLFVALFCYAWFTKRVQVIDKRPLYTSGTGYLVPPYIFKPYHNDSVVDAVTAAEVKKLIAKKKRAALMNQSPVEAPKKKRKKFLGIF